MSMSPCPGIGVALCLVVLATTPAIPAAAACRPFHAQQELPPALAALVADRMSVANGEVEFTWSSSRWRETRHYTSRFTADDQLLIWHGDEEGVLWRDADGRPRTRTVSDVAPYYTLAHNGYTWLVNDGAPLGDVRRQAGAVSGAPDMRSLGFTVGVPFWDPDQSLALPGAEYVVSEGPDAVRVVAVLGDLRTTWTLDPQSRLPVSIRQERRGELLREARIQLARTGDRWYPRSVEFFTSDHKGGLEPSETIRVTRARFDAPDLPQQITPADIGIDAGFNAIEYDENMRRVGNRIWDGSALVSSEEYSERVRRGELQPGEHFKRNVARASLMQREAAALLAETPERHGPARRPRLFAPLEEWEGEWDRYVRDFCERYDLDASQRQHAQRLLQDCKARARDYIQRKQHAVDAFERARTNFLKLGPAEQAARKHALAQQRAALVAPLSEIFETRLKPGLEKLPTRAQRRAADPQPASATRPSADSP
jgi:hypothetical protein